MRLKEQLRVEAKGGAQVSGSTVSKVQGLEGWLAVWLSGWMAGWLAGCRPACLLEEGGGVAQPSGESSGQPPSQPQG